MWPWPWTIAEHVRGEAMRQDKGMLKGERRINRQCELRSQSVVEEDGPRERERWARVDESCELTI